MIEPILSAEDSRLWDMWQRTAMVHAGTRLHRRRVDAARTIMAAALECAPNLAVMWSGGKDSTAMTHLACVESGARLTVYSEKDDLDYPGELAYVTELGAQWGLDLKILVPPISPSGWISKHGHKLSASDDMHSRAAALSKECFYQVVESATAHCGGIMLGLRAAESKGRKANRAARGPLYKKASGQWVCTPLADWSGLDVMAYCAVRGIGVLPVYRCISLDPEHAARPWLVRKSWWIQGANARLGGVAWLRHYWPSLYRQLCAWMSDARTMS